METKVNNVQMEGFDRGEVKKLVPIVREILASYGKRPEGQSVQEWVEQQLAERLPEYSPSEVAGTAEALTQEIEKFDANLADMASKCNEKLTKEAWMAQQLEQVPEGMDAASYGKYIEQVQGAVASSNQAIMQATQAEQGRIQIAEAEVVSDGSGGPYNKYTLRSNLRSLAQQTAFAGTASVMLPQGMRMGVEAAREETVVVPQLEKEATGTESKGLKNVATLALKVCSEKGMISFLPRGTSNAVVSNIACAGVESVKAVADYATGKATAMGALERIGRSTISAAVNMVKSGAGPKVISLLPAALPYVGCAVAAVATVAVAKKLSPVIERGIEKIKPVVEPIYKKACAVVQQGWQAVKNVGKKIMSFFGF